MINEIHFGDCRDSLRQMLAAGITVQTCVTSPPYFGLRDYGHAGQIGLEETPEQFIAELVDVFRCVRDVLADDGTLWLNIGDSYGGWGQLQMIPARVALALQADGWVLRQEIVWSKPNAMPEPVKNRCTKSHESLFLLAKKIKYFYNMEAIREPLSEVSLQQIARSKTHPVSEDKRAKGGNPDRRDSDGLLSRKGRASRGAAMNEAGRNKRSVWTIATKPYKGAHFAVFPSALVEPCILAGSRPGDVVLDPFMGSGTTAAVAIKHGRQFIGCELNADYKPLQDERILNASKKLVEILSPQIDLFAMELA